MGSGFDRRLGEKKADGSGRTVDWDLGKRYGALDCFWIGSVGGGSRGGDMLSFLGEDGGDGENWGWEMVGL